MQGDGKNLKDPERKLAASYGAGPQIVSDTLSYTKTNKLITALYMVTDIIDDREPLRHKLRTLGTEIISDVYSLSVFPTGNGSMRASSKIAETLSFLDIAATINIISPMNSSILQKEFLELQKSILESISNNNFLHTRDLSDFFKEELTLPKASSKEITNKSIGHPHSTRIGVQKGSTLMKALSDKASTLSNIRNARSGANIFDNLKKERRDEIVSIIKNASTNSGESTGATITDIRNKAQGPLVSCGEKTLQRELVSMVKDTVLYKTGSKRWSRYFMVK